MTSAGFSAAFSVAATAACVDPHTESLDTAILCGQKLSKQIIWQQSGD
jgi:hypothetical protein